MHPHRTTSHATARSTRFAPSAATLAAAVAGLVAALLAAGCVASLPAGGGDERDPDPGSAAGTDPGSQPGSESGPGDDTGTSVGTSIGTRPIVTPPDDPSHLFSASSPWNIRAAGSVDGASATMITSGATGSLAWAFATTGHSLDIAGTDDYPDYGIPLYLVGAGAPTVRVTDKVGWWGGFATVPIPADAKPSVGIDHHLSIWDVAHHQLFEFWQMQRNSDGTWTAGAGVVFDPRGTGYQSALWSLSARSYGGAAIAGLIRRDELNTGLIAHALALAYPGTRGQRYAAGLGADGITQNIASHSDNVTDASRNGAGNIPAGARLRLKASVNVTTRCAGNTACRIIGTALQNYGAYVVDHSGVPTLYAEVLTGRSATWSGLLRRTDASMWTAADFELLALPAALTATPQ